MKNKFHGGRSTLFKNDGKSNVFQPCTHISPHCARLSLRLPNQILANSLHLSRPLQAPGTYRCQKMKLHIFVFCSQNNSDRSEISSSDRSHCAGPENNAPRSQRALESDKNPIFAGGKPPDPRLHPSFFFFFYITLSLFLRTLTLRHKRKQKTKMCSFIF